jgi:type II secretory pathway pseudopilin PulG
MPVLLWIIARPRLVAVIMSVLLLAYTAYRLYTSGADHERQRQQAEATKTVEGALKGAAEAQKDLSTRPVDELMREKGWLRDRD